MTETAVVFTDVASAPLAARDLSTKIREAMPAGPPDALILFASPRYDHPTLLRELATTVEPRVLVGASSAGEFTNEHRGEGLACALALRSTDLHFAAGVGTGLSRDRRKVAQSITASFCGAAGTTYEYRSALVMTDALAGHADELVDELTLATSGTYQFFGGGAGDNAQFQRTQVFHGTEALSDAAVALEILSHKPLGIGVGHGWEPASPKMRVTEVRGTTVVSLNGLPAVQAFQRHAASTGQKIETANPIPFFLHNILGIETAAGYRLRVPLAVHEDGSIDCASELPVGSVVSIMRTTAKSSMEAAERAIGAAMKSLGDSRPKVALFFDCVATRLRMGELFGLELKSIADQLGDASFLGCNTHGQIARAEGQFGGFHNCTAVVCVLPE